MKSRNETNPLENLVKDLWMGRNKGIHDSKNRDFFLKEAAKLIKEKK